MNNFLTLEWALGILLSLATTALWRFVQRQSDVDKELAQEIKQIAARLHDVELRYQSKNDAKDDRAQIMALLQEIKSSLHHVTEKLDQKADKP